MKENRGKLKKREGKNFFMTRIRRCDVFSPFRRMRELFFIFIEEKRKRGKNDFIGEFVLC